MGVVAGLAGVAGLANAAQHINPEGTGEVLIYPYYTVKNGLDTLYSVVNTTGDTKAVKVRFLEGENTIEVLDFNVYMSAFDVWTGSLSAIKDADGNVVNGQHSTNDLSCAPYLNPVQPFLPFAMQQTDTLAVDENNVGLNRATEGHFEVLEMGTYPSGTSTYADSDHGTNGIPSDCDAIESDWDDNVYSEAEDVTTGGLFGSASLVNVAEGLAMTYDAIAIDDFWLGGAGEHTRPGNLLPSISSGDRNILIFDQGAAVALNYPSGAEAISGLFQRKEVYNEYALDTFVAGKTEWVVTFPTKNPHVNNALGAVLPFTNSWDGLRSCHEFTMLIWDREEQQEAPGGGTISPEPPVGTNPNLCYETNVIRFLQPEADPATKSILGSSNLTTVRTPSVAHATENGWAKISFAAYTDANGYEGLPVAGFAAQQFTNVGAGEGLLAQYAGLFVHKGLICSANATDPNCL